MCDILIRMDRHDEASRLARQVLTIASTKADRALADSVLAQIKQRQEWILETKRREEAAEERRRQQAKELEELRSRATGIEEQQQEESYKPASANRPAIKRGPAGKVIGVVKSVKCDYPAVMDVVLDSGGKQKTYRAENYYQVKYWAVGAPGKSGFEPCEELQGKRVQIEFQSVAGQEFSGVIQTVAIEK